nr:hypothetical protein [Tanacetum cinerariifolium]
MEDKKMEKQGMNSFLEKLWYLADEDDEEETYVFDMNEFLAIQKGMALLGVSLCSGRDSRIIIPPLNENCNAIACDFSPLHTAVSVYSLDTFQKEYKGESKVFDLLKIDVDLFTCDTPLWMIFDEFSRLSSTKDDLFAYKVGVLEDSYFPYVEQPYNNLENGDLDIYEPQKCYNEYERMFVEAVISIDNRLDYEWYEAMEDGKLKEEALRNKAIMEGTLDDDDESSYERRKQ